MSPTKQIEPPKRIKRSLFIGGETPLDHIEVFAVACMAACGTSEKELHERFNIELDELNVFLGPNASMLGDSWAEHLITTYMDACKEEDNAEKALSRFNKAAKIIVGWYDCCCSMLDLYSSFAPSEELPDLASFSALLLRYCAEGIVHEILNKEAAEDVADQAKTFAVACEYLSYLSGEGTQDDTAVLGQLKAPPITQVTL